jgi:hypothetical protein
MHQQEIQFFWPLTEQIKLDLDFTECDKPKLYTTIPLIGGTGMTLMSTGDGAVTWSTRLGDWEIPNEKKQPNKFQKVMMKYFLGWKWMGK